MTNHILELPSAWNVDEVHGIILAQIKIRQCSTPYWPLVRYGPSTKHDQSYFRIPSAYFVKCWLSLYNKTARETSFFKPFLSRVENVNSKTSLHIYKTYSIRKMLCLPFKSCIYKRFLVRTKGQMDGQTVVLTIYGKYLYIVLI